MIPRILLVFLAVIIFAFDTDVPQPSVKEPLTRKDVLRYDIYADFTREPITEYRSEVSIDFVAYTTLDTIFFDLIENTVDSVFLDGARADFHQFDEALAIIGVDIEAGDTANVIVHYRGEYPNDAIKYGFDLDGIGVAYSLFWASLGRFFYPCVDYPLDKAKSSVAIRTTATSLVVSNGAPVETYTPPDDSSEKVTVWRNDYQICTYNICFSFSENYAQIDTSFSIPSGELPIRYFFPSEWEARTRYAFNDLSNMITLYDTLFGDFPFDNYGMYVSSFSAGAMEHQSMVMMGEFTLEDPDNYQDMIAHELSHQWWGDALSLGDWRDFWLNEGLAVYCECLYYEFCRSPEEGRALLHETQQSYLDYAPYEGIFPIYDPDEYLSYTVYRKGAAVFHMLRRLIGDEPFFQGLRQYYERHRYGNVTSDSLFNVMEEISDMDLSTFRAQWVERGGWPQFGYWYSLDGTGLHIFIEQTEDMYQLPMQIGVYDGGVEHIHNVFIDENPAHFHFDDVLVMDSLKLDPYGDILCEIEYLEGVEEQLVPDLAEISIYPNPVNSTVQIDIDRISATLFDINGRAVESWHERSRTMDLSALPSGVYTVRTADGVLSERLLLLK